MPIYEYQCEKCNKVHEFWQKISDAPVLECPDCCGALHKLVSLSSFQLKGGGWYVDGYSVSKGKGKNSSKKKDNSTEKEVKNESPKGQVKISKAAIDSSD